MTNTDEILTQFSGRTIFFPRFQFAYSQMLNAVEMTKLRKTPSSAFLIGESGTGKSKLCEIFTSKFPLPSLEADEDGEQSVRPVIKCLVPSPITIKGLCQQLLMLCEFDGDQGSVVQLTQSLIARIKTCRVQVIILDEIQRLMLSEASKIRASTIAWIISLLTETQATMILTGTTECEELLTSNAPLRRRFPFVVNLYHLCYSTEPNSELYLTLKGLDQELYRLAELAEGAHLHQPAVEASLYVATRGNLEYLRQIMFIALHTCLNRGDKRLTHQDFFDACQLLFLPDNLAEGRNPFALSLTECLDLIRKYSRE